ncbi:hypothetical protein [Tritonibacter mobilis]|uniref:Uncharacterized protein n=1 Tax=Tritonibacter mobilis F1926 TaxID=1265309 RepID=A0A1B1A8S7_9RHOB|nr:hypothetical protein [Tritonibacter mobilis]ANP42946.1 hypothetical protein K529_019470 [Tritonibacter mobilis F1926]KJZ21632.1 hypothetical protein TW79_21725 [Tritonibacter mobilis]
MVECNDPLQRCFEGNLFRANMPRSNVVIEGAVNGDFTGPLPNGEVFKLDKSLEETVNKLEAKIGNKTYPIVDDLGGCNITRPEQVGFAMSEILATDGNQGGPSSSDVEEVLVLQVPPSLQATAPGLGDHDIDTAPEEVLLWIATSIVTSLELIDESAGLTGLYEWSGEYIDLQLTGTDSSPVLAELANLVRHNDIRNGLRSVLQGGSGLFKIGMNAAGFMFIAFRQSRNMGIFVTGAAAALARSRANTIFTGIKGALSRSATSVKGIPVVGFVIVGVIDFMQWYADPNARGDWVKLISILAPDMGALAISTLAGGVVATVAAGIVSTAFAASVIGVLTIAGAGIIAGLAVGMVVTALANRFGVSELVERGLRALGQGAETAIQYVAEVVEAAINQADEFLTHASPGDGRITGPTDYLMEVDRGIMDYINSRIGFPSR